MNSMIVYLRPQTPRLYILYIIMGSTFICVPILRSVAIIVEYQKIL